MIRGNCRPSRKAEPELEEIETRITENKGASILPWGKGGPKQTEWGKKASLTGNAGKALQAGGIMELLFENSTNEMSMNPQTNAGHCRTEKSGDAQVKGFLGKKGCTRRQGRRVFTCAPRRRGAEKSTGGGVVEKVYWKGGE